MKDYKQLAQQNFKCGYNCCQAVLLAFCDELGLDKETAARLSSSFGGGMGRMREVCGAVSGMFMVAGLNRGYSEPTAHKEKAEHYDLITEMAKEFKQENGSIICRELLAGVSKTEGTQPEERTQEYYKKRPCAELVACAAEIAAKYLNNNK